MSLTHEDLPRMNGVPVGLYNVRHTLPDFALSGFGFRFEAGRSVEPLTGRPLLRLLYSMSADLTVEPADEETGRAICEWLHDRGRLERLDEVKGMCAALFGPPPSVETDEQRAAREATEAAAREQADANEKAAQEAAELAALEVALAAIDANESTPAVAAPGEAGELSAGAVAATSSKDKGKRK